MYGHFAIEDTVTTRYGITQNVKRSGYYDIVPTDNNILYVLKVLPKDYETAERLCDETIMYIDALPPEGEDAPFPPPPTTQLKVEGKIKELSKEDKMLVNTFRQELASAGYTNEEMPWTIFCS